jgi:hypothetical protein
MFRIDVETCPHCGDRIRLLALITEPPNVARFPPHLGESTEPPPRAPARDPPSVRNSRRSPPSLCWQCSGALPHPPRPVDRRRPGASGDDWTSFDFPTRARNSGGAGPLGDGGAAIGAGGTAIGAGGTTTLGAGGAAIGTGGTAVGTGGSGSTGLPPDATCYEIRARQDASNTPFTVPTTPDYYNCFSYAVPWGADKVHIVRTRPLIDNNKVIHHWILYNNSGALTNGASAQCTGAHPDAAFIAGWAPGGQEETMPHDVGLAVTGQGFTLEAHYNNGIGAGQLDKSGVEVCVTKNLRPHEAQVSWLGTQNLSKVNATGKCAPALTGPVTVLSSSPHMHLQGRHMKTVINRVGGGVDVLLDQPFDFNTQVSYPTPAVINPGDTLTTTCTYAQPTPFGSGTTSEMCYNFVTAYPGGALTNGHSFLRINDCTANQ